LIIDKGNSKFNFPFRIGCTSYVFPGDIVFNANIVSHYFDDIELVFFQSHDACNFPDDKTIANLCDVAKQFSITYTVHFPIDKKAGATNESERSGFVKQVKDLITITRNLDPFAYILHFEGVHRNALAVEKKLWYKQILKTSEEIESFVGNNRYKISVENLDYPYSWHADIVEKFGFSYCIDVGHLMLYKEDVDAVAKEILHKTRVLHVHGVHQGKDHISLKNSNIQLVSSILNVSISQFTGVATIETFSERDTFESLEMMKELWLK